MSATLPHPARFARNRVRLALIAFGALAVAHIPSLMVTGYFADDWSYVYLAHFERFGSIMHSLWEAGHPLYGPWGEIFLRLGDLGPLLARLASLALHGLNTYLLFRLLRRPRITRRVAMFAAALFFVSPFCTIRGAFANSVYDLFISAWLLSVIWMDDRSRWRRAAAPLWMAFSMGLEPMIMLEPLRVLYVWGRRGHPEQVFNSWQVLRRVSVFWAVALLMIALRLTLYRPSGHYAGFHPLKLDPLAVLGLLQQSFGHIYESLFLAFYNTRYLLPYWQMALIALLALGLYIRLAPPRIARVELAAIPLGIALFALGALPYALIGEYLWPYRDESRFALVAQIGAVIGLAAVVQALPFKIVRGSVAFLLLMLCAFSVAGDGKWRHLDQELQRDVTRQMLVALRQQPEPIVVRLAIEPGSRHIIYRSRCLGAADFNVPLALVDGNRQPRSYVYELECGDLNPERGYCTLSYFDQQPCPEGRVNARYLIDLERSSVPKTTLWDALGWTGRPPHGRLEFATGLAGSTVP
jgi:hypothetical protein